jgi:hypothetical protein
VLPKRYVSLVCGPATLWARDLGVIIMRKRSRHYLLFFFALFVVGLIYIVETLQQPSVPGPTWSVDSATVVQTSFLGRHRDKYRSGYLDIIGQTSNIILFGNNIISSKLTIDSVYVIDLSEYKLVWVSSGHWLFRGIDQSSWDIPGNCPFSVQISSGVYKTTDIPDAVNRRNLCLLIYSDRAPITVIPHRYVEKMENPVVPGVTRH